MAAFDPGPPDTFAAIFDAMPDHSGVRGPFWFRRGRLDGRAMTPRRNNWVYRPLPDDEHTLIWTAPTT